ncbi:MAG: ABC transporter ATP-binding protein [Burkholderiales bacterium]|jgi:peptide/nickel transport system ATP-binding protein
MDTPVLSINQLSVALPAGADRAYAVQNISLTLDAGETLCVVGESGSGKSVLAMTVMGLLARELRVSEGEIMLQNVALFKADESQWRALRGRAMGMVFQEPMTALNPVMRCGEQIDEVLRCHTDWQATTRREAVLDIMRQVRLPEPERMLDSYPHQLSGGQRQRIVIAMAMVLKPALLICDEPTTALDVTTQQEILKLIRQLQQDSGTAVLFITHDMGVVADIADRVLVMHKGLAVEQGHCQQVLKQPVADYTRALLAAVPGMTPPAARPLPQTPPVLRVQGLGKTYVSRESWMRVRRTDALRDASLSLRAGETVGIVGESGSGKSTLARCVLRLIDPDIGDVFWGQDNIAGLSEAQLRPLRHRIQVVFQDPNRSLNPRMRVGESLVEGARNFGLNNQQAQERGRALLAQTGLPAHAWDRYPSQFSGGQRQRIALARALACQPDVLVADEAVSALDVSVQAQILELLREVQRNMGLGLLFITHDLRVAAQLCDSVIVMHHGQIVEHGATAQLYANPQHAYTRNLLASVPGASP